MANPNLIAIVGVPYDPKRHVRGKHFSICKSERSKLPCLWFADEYPRVENEDVKILLGYHVKADWDALSFSESELNEYNKIVTKMKAILPKKDKPSIWVITYFRYVDSASEIEDANELVEG